MRQQFEYRSLHLPGLSDSDQENVSLDAINHLLKERTRTYNRLGAEGWALIAEHMEIHGYAAIATFRRFSETAEDAASSNQSSPVPPVPTPHPTKQDAGYPTLQPDPAAPDKFRLVWEK